MSEQVKSLIYSNKDLSFNCFAAFKTDNLTELSGKSINKNELCINAVDFSSLLLKRCTLLI